MIRASVGSRCRGLTGLSAVLLAIDSGCAGRPRPVSVQPAVEPVMRKVADAVLRDFPEPPAFDWGEGTLMAGMMRAGLSVDEPRYIEFVRRWADHWRAEGIERILEGAPNARFRAYCGAWGPGFPIALLFESTGAPAYLEMCRQIAEFVMTRATRTPEGGLAHWGGNQQLWVDTLYMVCPLFAHLTGLTGEPVYLDEAVRQIDLYARYCQDEQTGLFWHMYDAAAKRRVGALWGRGNGWAAMSYVEVLRHLERGSPRFGRLRGQFRRQMSGLLAVQDPASHLWHTVLDRPETYVETSASAMILASLVDAGRLGLYEIGDPQGISRAWAALAARVDGDGRVGDVSGGTTPQSFEGYASKVRGTYTWGTGAFLLAAGALQEGH